MTQTLALTMPDQPNQPAHPDNPGGRAQRGGSAAGRPKGADAAGLVVTIDGPAGTGKSSVARLLARRLGLDFLDTGAMYRAASVLVLDQGADPGDEARVAALVAGANIRFDWTTDPPAILAGGSCVAHRIRGQEITAIVSRVAAIAKVREVLVAQQRAIAAAHPRLVTEGRDQGSVVFPDAKVKIYLDASPRIRAERRAAQLAEQGVRADVAGLEAEIARRDELDSTRAAGPLVCPADAVRVDTSMLSRDQVVDELERIVLSRLVAGADRGEPS
jgi:cytidylate kinase